MIIGLIGLGRMGQAVAARLVKAGIDVIGHDKDPTKTVDLSIHEGPFFEQNQTGTCSCSTKHTQEKQHRPGTFTLTQDSAFLAAHTSVIMIFVPAKEAVDAVLDELLPHLNAKHIIIDGGNSFFKDSLRRFALLQEHNVAFLDCGTSGGLQGRAHGFCLMVGGLPQAYEHCVPFFKAIAAPGGYGLVGPPGAGHYTKMVHNGIEYALLEAYAEGFEILKKCSYKELDLAQISGIWNQGSIVRSWILELSHHIFLQDQEFKNISGIIHENGTGRWTVEEAERCGISPRVIAQALHIRADSRKTGGTYATKLVALLRQAFGGHAVTYLSPEQPHKKGESNS